MGWEDIDQIDGDPATLRSCAEELSDLALDLTVLWQACNGLGDIADELSWQGESQQAYMEKVDQNPKGSDIDSVQAAFREAAATIETLASKMAETQATIEWCQTRIDDLDVPSGGDLALSDGTIAPEVQAELDAIYADAQAARDDWYAARDEAAETFVALRGNAVYTDPPVGFWDETWWGFNQFTVQPTADFFVGAYEGVAESVVGIWKLGEWWYTTPGMTLYDKAFNDPEVLDAIIQMAIFHAQNPGPVWEEGTFWNEMLQSVVEWDLLMENPSKWFGKLAPGIVIGIFTGGIGAAAVWSLRGGAVLSRLGGAAMALARAAATMFRPDRLVRLADNVASSATRLGAGLADDLMRVNRSISVFETTAWGRTVGAFIDEATAMVMVPVANAASAAFSAIGTVTRNVAGELVHLTDNVLGGLTGHHNYELVGADGAILDRAAAIDPADLVLTGWFANGTGPNGPTGSNLPTLQPGATTHTALASVATPTATPSAPATPAVNAGAPNNAVPTTVGTGPGGSHPLDPGAGSGTAKPLDAPGTGAGTDTPNRTTESTPTADGGRDDKEMGEPLDYPVDDPDERTNRDIDDDRFEDWEKEFPNGHVDDPGPVDLADAGTTHAGDGNAANQPAAAEHHADAQRDLEAAGAFGLSPVAFHTAPPWPGSAATPPWPGTTPGSTNGTALLERPATAQWTARAGDPDPDGHSQGGGDEDPAVEPETVHLPAEDGDASPPPPSSGGPADPPNQDPPPTAFGGDSDDRDDGDAAGDPADADGSWGSEENEWNKWAEAEDDEKFDWHAAEEALGRKYLPIVPKDPPPIPDPDLHDGLEDGVTPSERRDLDGLDDENWDSDPDLMAEIDQIEADAASDDLFDDFNDGDESDELDELTDEFGDYDQFVGAPGAIDRTVILSNDNTRPELLDLDDLDSWGEDWNGFTGHDDERDGGSGVPRRAQDGDGDSTVELPANWDAEAQDPASGNASSTDHEPDDFDDDEEVNYEEYTQEHVDELGDWAPTNDDPESAIYGPIDAAAGEGASADDALTSADEDGYVAFETDEHDDFDAWDEEMLDVEHQVLVVESGDDGTSADGDIDDGDDGTATAASPDGPDDHTDDDSGAAEPPADEADEGRPTGQSSDPDGDDSSAGEDQGLTDAVEEGTTVHIQDQSLIETAIPQADRELVATGSVAVPSGSTTAPVQPTTPFTHGHDPLLTQHWTAHDGQTSSPDVGGDADPATYHDPVDVSEDDPAGAPQLTPADGPADPPDDNNPPTSIGPDDPSEDDVPEVEDETDDGIAGEAPTNPDFYDDPRNSDPQATWTDEDDDWFSDQPDEGDVDDVPTVPWYAAAHPELYTHVTRAGLVRSNDGADYAEEDMDHPEDFEPDAPGDADNPEPDRPAAPDEPWSSLPEAHRPIDRTDAGPILGIDDGADSANPSNAADPSGSSDGNPPPPDGDAHDETDEDDEGWEWGSDAAGWDPDRGSTEPEPFDVDPDAYDGLTTLDTDPSPDVATAPDNSGGFEQAHADQSPADQGADGQGADGHDTIDAPDPDGDLTADATPSDVDDVSRPAWIDEEFPWLSDVNPSGSNTNCAACSLATDRRLAGDDTAQATATELTSGDWIEEQTGVDAQLLGGDPAMARYEIEMTMLRHLADPASGTPRGIVLAWRLGPDGNLTGGHIFNVTADSSGMVRFIDGQTGGEVVFDDHLGDPDGPPVVRFDLIDTTNVRYARSVFDGSGDVDPDSADTNGAADPPTDPPYTPPIPTRTWYSQMGKQPSWWNDGDSPGQAGSPADTTPSSPDPGGADGEPPRAHETATEPSNQRPSWLPEMWQANPLGSTSRSPVITVRERDLADKVPQGGRDAYQLLTRKMLPPGSPLGSNTKYLATFTDGTHGLFKPVDGESPFLQEAVGGGTLADREVNVSRAAEYMGSRAVPPTTPHDGPYGQGSMQLWMPTTRPGLPPGHYLQWVQDDIRAIDYGVGHLDRDLRKSNYRTILNEETGELEVAAVDNGLSGPASSLGWSIVSPFITHNWGEPFNDNLMDRLSSMDLDVFGGIVSHGTVPDRVGDDAIDRVREMRRYGTITGEAWGRTIHDGLRLQVFRWPTWEEWSPWPEQ